MDDLPSLPQQIDLVDLCCDEVVAGTLEGSCGLLDQSVHVLYLDPEEDALVMSTQVDNVPVPVVFSGLADGAHDCFVEDSEEKQLSCSTKNAPEPEEEQSNFILVESSSDEGSIPAAQLRYKLKDMWW